MLTGSQEKRPLPESYFPVSVAINPQINIRSNKKLKHGNSPSPLIYPWIKFVFPATYAASFLQSPLHSKKLQKRNSPLSPGFLEEIFFVPCAKVSKG